MSLKTNKKWLWLLIPGIPAAVLCVLFLPLALMMAGHLGGALFGPVNVWNSTDRMPSDTDVIGSYDYSESGSVNDEDPRVTVPSDSGFTLGPNHDLEVQNLPKLDGFGRPTGCAYNDTGKWGIAGNGGGFSLSMNITAVLPANPGNLPSCDPEYFGDFEVLGKSRPYRFWYYIDDPDTGEGLLYELR